MTILLLFLMAAAITLFITKARNPSAYWMATILLGWFFSMFGLVMFIAKYGGIYYKVNFILFFHDSIRNLLLHSPISIEMISRMITVGRSVFIFGLLGLSVSLFYYRSFKHLWKIHAANTLLPILNIIMYDPIVYKWSLGVIDRSTTYVIGWAVRAWLIASTLVAVVLMLKRYKTITIPWFKKQMQHILLSIAALILFYFYLGFMGPLQVSDVRTYYFLYSDFSNFNPPLSLVEWYLGLIITGGLSIVGILAIWKYTGVEKKFGQLDLSLERKLRTADMGTKVFTHAIKNQLLMMQLLLKETKSHPNAADLHADIESNLDKTLTIVNETLARLDLLYKSFKTSSIKLKPISIQTLIDNVLEKVPDSDRVQLTKELCADNPLILADETHLPDAVSNIVTNAFEAIGKDRHGNVTLSTYVEDKWIIIQIVDNGKGMTDEQLELIFDPFYTNKNTNRNWGVGLSFAKQILKMHYGHIHTSSKPDVGSSFQIFLPIYLMNDEPLPVYPITENGVAT